MDIEKIRHSLAHILALAVKEMYPNVKFGVGPAIENGFYYDFDFNFSNKKRITNLSNKSQINSNESRITKEMLPKIEKKMKELIKKDLKFKKGSLTTARAKKIFKDQPYKLELIEELVKNNQPITVYYTFEKNSISFEENSFEKNSISFGENSRNIFIDLCAGPHVKSTKEINPEAFKLTKVAGAYWKGDEKKPMLTRIYGIAFKTKEELEEYFKHQEESEKRDHRILGQKLELFLINEEIGQGLPIWLPKGAIIRKIIENYLYEELQKEGYQWIYTPHIGSRKLWETSGHWNFYSESMYPPLEVGQSLEEKQKAKKPKIKEEYLLKPMNCPFHVYVYKSKIRSYRDLPIKLAELGTVYRYERSGTLHGLTRVRGFTQDDAHIICTQDQITEELEKLLKQGLAMLKKFGFKNFNIYLSTQPEKFAGTQKMWDKATKALKYVLSKEKLNYQTDKGGGVFYGPKIDIKIKDSLDREWQCTTIQFDFNLPERFQMTYIDKNGKEKTPFMIHRALLGSLERFFGVLIEHYAGAFPFWLAPEQIWIIPVGQGHIKYANSINKQLTTLQLTTYQLRTKVKDEKETVSKKIREGEIQKIPYLLVVGDKEMKNKTVRVRERGKGDIGEMKIEKLIKKIKTNL
jgi:threonyl-tRNA synthetase